MLLKSISRPALEAIESRVTRDIETRVPLSHCRKRVRLHAPMVVEALADAPSVEHVPEPGDMLLVFYTRRLGTGSYYDDCLALRVVEVERVTAQRIYTTEGGWTALDRVVAHITEDTEVS